MKKGTIDVNGGDCGGDSGGKTMNGGERGVVYTSNNKM